MVLEMDCYNLPCEKACGCKVLVVVVTRWKCSFSLLQASLQWFLSLFIGVANECPIVSTIIESNNENPGARQGIANSWIGEETVFVNLAVTLLHHSIATMFSLHDQSRSGNLSIYSRKIKKSCSSSHTYPWQDVGHLRCGRKGRSICLTSSHQDLLS